MMLTWSDPFPLCNYGHAPKQTGIYILGEAKDTNAPVVKGSGDCAYLQRDWPANFRPVYVGISENKTDGIYNRIRTHATNPSNKKLKEYRKQKRILYFIYACGGYDVVNFEVLFDSMRKIDALGNEQFDANVRREWTRAAARTAKHLNISPPDYLPEDYDAATDYM